MILIVGLTALGLLVGGPRSRNAVAVLGLVLASAMAVAVGLDGEDGAGGAVAAWLLVAAWFTVLVGFGALVRAAVGLFVPPLRWGHPA